MSAKTETLAAIIAEMREAPADAEWNGHALADRIEAAADLERAIADAMREALVEILDRTNREKARDYDAALNCGILEIHDIANTALNQERTADALEKVLATGNAAAIRDALKAVFEKLLECAPTAEQEWPELVERARTALERKPEENYGNAVALREALEQAKRDHWFDMSPDLRNKIFAAISAPPEPPSNDAALRAVVKRCRDYLADLLTLINPEDENRLLKECDAALAAPPESPSDAAKMREAILAIKSVNDRRPHDADGYEINDIIEEALALEKGKEADNG